MTDNDHLTRAEVRASRRPAIYTPTFWVDTSERVISSAAGGALAVAATTTFVLGDPLSWAALGAGAGVAALVSLLKAVVASQTGTGSPSIAPSV